ncbi:hypothetical protein IJ732_07350 [bacterium]|nr:hypothetical protein [bacterium]
MMKNIISNNKNQIKGKKYFPIPLTISDIKPKDFFAFSSLEIFSKWYRIACLIIKNQPLKNAAHINKDVNKPSNTTKKLALPLLKILL